MNFGNIYEINTGAKNKQNKTKQNKTNKQTNQKKTKQNKTKSKKRKLQSNSKPLTLQQLQCHFLVFQTIFFTVIKLPIKSCT